MSNTVKTISGLIEELKSFQDSGLIVVVSDDGGETLKPVRLVGKDFDEDGNPYCTLYID